MIRDKKRKRWIAMLLILSILMCTLPIHVYAAPKALNERCLNTAVKYLYLGDQASATYKFSISKHAQEIGSKYYWYVKEDKGNPEAVSIDSKTGIVTARNTGTAYIRCKITRTDKTVLRPEAMVIVRNNITGVKISNLPKDMTISAGTATDFNQKITDTAAGVGYKTEGITRWEVAEDTAGVNVADEEGIVFPTKEGQFSIRAVSFESLDRYMLWLMNKEKYKDRITATSKWHTIKVTESEGSAIVNTQEQLDKALASEIFKKITISTENPLTFTIKSGINSDKELIVDAPNADVKNYGTFKSIAIKAIKDSTWIEYANGNVIHLLDTKLHFIIENTANIKQITVEQQDSSVELEIHGKVELISVQSSSTINLTGDALNVPVVIEGGAGGSFITTSVPLNLVLNANTNIKLNQGAEKTNVDKRERSIEAKVENNTKVPIIITTNKAGVETVAAGGSKISNVSTVPVYTDNSSQVPVAVSNITISPKNMVVPVSGSSLSVLVAIATPENAVNTEVTWKSVDESVAIVSDDGTVTPVSLGMTPVTATLGGVTAVAYVNVVESVTGSAIQPGLLHASGSTVADELKNGAEQYVGGQLMGWGLKEMGIGFEDATDSEIKNMAKKLDEMNKKLDKLSIQMDQLSKQLSIVNYDIRVGQLGRLISNITNIKDAFNDFINKPIKNDPKLLMDTRIGIMNSIYNQLVNNEDMIHDQLVGNAGQQSLIKIWSNIVKNKNTFLDSEDSKIVQAMYDYLEQLQTTMLELEVEYFHAFGEGGENCNNINRLIFKYNAQIEEQRSLLLQPIPENVMIDTKQNIMIYKGYFYHKFPFTKTTINKNIPLHATYAYRCFSFQCDTLGFDNWRWLKNKELKTWINAGNGNLYNYLMASGWRIPMNELEKIGDSDEFTVDSAEITGYKVASGERVAQVLVNDGNYTDMYNYLGDAKEYKYYWFRVRDMKDNEIGKYFYTVIKKQ